MNKKNDLTDCFENPANVSEHGPFRTKEELSEFVAKAVSELTAQGEINIRTDLLYLSAACASLSLEPANQMGELLNYYKRACEIADSYSELARKGSAEGAQRFI